MNFYLCKLCGNIADVVSGPATPMSCCGEVMTLLAANTVEASQEKHLPHVTKTDDGIKVQVGSVAHPMEEAHFIDFIVVKTEKGAQRVKLNIGAAPEAEFCFAAGDGPVEVYEYCNLHGLWKVTV